MTSIELDTNITRDRQLIVNHDTAVNGKICRYENGQPAETIPIRDLTVDELKRLDCGAVADDAFPEQVPVPGTRLITLTEFFEFVSAYEREHPAARPIRFNVETKFGDDRSPEAVGESARLVVAAIEAAGMAERSTVQSFVHGVLPEVRHLNPRIQTSALFEPTPFQSVVLGWGIGVGRKRIIRETLSMGADIVSPDYRFVSERFVRCCHEMRLKVLPWVVNDESDMARLIGWGVDGLISDYPDRLYRACTRTPACRVAEA